MSEQVRIRMYNVGFGDCFLIVLPEQRTILIDAGFHMQGKGKFSGNELAEKIIEDLIELRGTPRIDVVIATHRHQDHIFAFNSTAWDQVEVGEVWLPWVEDRNDAAAAKLWEKKRRFAEELRGLAAAPLDPTRLPFGLTDEDREHIEFALWNAGVPVHAWTEPTMAGWSNQGALDCLHEGFKRRDRSRPRFLPEKKAYPDSFESEALPRVKVHVLGPPKDPDLIEELDPEADGETYRALAILAADADPSLGCAHLTPFAAAWQVPAAEIAPDPLDYDTQDRLHDLARGADPLYAATALDDMINSTSLVLLLEVGTARLLFCGDAEWGTWKRILADEEARGLLRGATFLKVGHHGSHNATPKSLVEKYLPRGIPAMIPTQEGAGRYRHGIPLAELLEAMGARDIQFVRSDDEDTRIPAGFERDPDNLWVELSLPC